ncbi:MAG TPA: hypothetical protein VKE27_11855 [Candidatus Dormibacteraeota bacterium]|nr:hypothetical protein [Candidatus Dormibacteraeota bacterium]
MQILLFIYLVTFGWQVRALMLPPGDPEIAVRTRTVFANGIWLGINAIAVAIYLLRGSRAGRYALGAALAFDLANSVLSGVVFLVGGDSTTAIQWWLIAVIPLLALVVLARQAQHEGR